jgi:hypothetical protein
MTSSLVKRLVLAAVIGTSASMLLMLAGSLYPSPLLLVLVMSIGQGLGILSLVLYLLAVTLDLQAVRALAEGHPAEGDETAPPGLEPGA